MSRPSVVLAAVGAFVGVEFAGEVSAQEFGTVLREQKIASSTGGFAGALDSQDRFGHALAALGDLDGDGIGDLAVGVPEDDDGGTNRGAVWLLFLASDGTVQRHAKVSSLGGGFTGRLDSTDRFGSAVAALGDLDGDGLVELAVGADQDDDGGINRGAVWLLSLAPDGTVGLATKISQTSGGFAGVLHNDDNFGHSLAALGDLDDDGIGELAVGAHLDDEGGTSRGAVWVLFLDALGSVRKQVKIASKLAGFAGPLDDADRFGVSVAALGDLDLDGTPDLAVGADQDDDGQSNAGGVWILFLQPDGNVRAEAKVSRPSGLALRVNDFFGGSLVSPGDVDGDGVADLAGGATLDDDGGLNRGAVWMLFLKRDGGLKSARKISAISGGLTGPLGNGGAFGCALAAPGDLDGDRRLDLIVGNENDSTGGTNRGAAWTLFLETALLPSLTVRNGLGINPVILTGDEPPVPGTIWEVAVDCRGFRNGVVIHLVVDTPREGHVRGRLGELLIEWCRPRILRSVTRHHGGPTRVFHSVPADPTLIGFKFYSQALVTGRGGARLTNALDGEFEGPLDPLADRKSHP